jgi:hypothetical protein
LEASIVGKSWPRWTVPLCELIADKIQEPNEWLKEFIENDAPPDSGEPFLRKAAAAQMPGWEESLSACFANPAYEGIALFVVLTVGNIRTDILDRALPTLTKYPQMVMTLCLRNQVPQEALMTLLSHRDQLVSTQAAIGVWCADPRGQIPNDVTDTWRAAILRAEDEQFWLAEILKSDRDIAFEWLRSRMERKLSFLPYYLSKEVKAAISVLNFEQRIALLQTIEDHGFVAAVLVAELAADDLQVFSEILKQPRLSKLHLSPLRGRPLGKWAEKATLAMNAGYLPDMIVSATLTLPDSWSGEVSQVWQEFVSDFEALRDHEDSRIRGVALIGAAKGRERQEHAAKRERVEAVYGR